MDDLGHGEIVDPRERPNLTFEEGSYTLPELLESHLLPVVAQYDVTQHPIPFQEFNFDLTQPLLLYKKRNIQKVVARSLQIEGEKYNEVGESLLVPEDYKGWFAVLQRVTGHVRADDTVPHFATVEEIANSNTDRFLIGGTKKISGLQLLDRSDAHLKHEQRYFLPGDILTREKIYYGETKKKTRLFRKSKYITEKFLMCRDECDREILLPFEQAGIFYQISHRTGKANKQVVQMSDIVARKLTPRIIKLVFGRFPLTPCSFTGIMRADSSKIETSIIASTLINTKNILMEIPVSSAMHFRVAVMNDDLRTNPCYRNAMGICAERAITYMRNIKVCYNFTNDDEEDDCFSEKQNDSLTNQTQNKSNFINNNNMSSLTTFKQNSRDSFGVSDKIDENSSIMRKQTLAEGKQGERRGFSVDIPDDVTLRPGRCLSAGRVSFCLGNNYLTVPMFDHQHFTKRDSGNNNTIHEMVYTTKSGSRLSFNGTFFEEVKEETDSVTNAGKTAIDIPPSLHCTNISSYVNMVKPPTIEEDAEDTDYIPASGCRRPSKQPPDTAPPPLPRSSSTSGVSSGSQSSVNDEISSNRKSSDSFEYAVPKTSPEVVSKVIEKQKPLGRRPSTFTFSEGCLGLKRSNLIKPITPAINDTDDTSSDDGCPIYENIQKLMEIVSKMENERNALSDVCTDDKPDADDQIDERSDLDETSVVDIDTTENSETNARNRNASASEELSIRSNNESNNIPLEQNECSCADNTTNCNVGESVLHSENNQLVVEGNLTCTSFINVKAGIDLNNPEHHSKTIVTLQENSESSQDYYDDRTIKAVDNAEVIVDESKADNMLDASIEYEIPTYQNERKDNSDLMESIEDVTTESKIGTVKQEICDQENFMEDMSNAKYELTKEPNMFDEINDTENNGEERNSPAADSNAAFVIQASQNKHEEYCTKHETNKESENQCLWRVAVEKNKNSSELLLSKGKIRALEKPISCLNIDEIAEELSCIGIKEETIEHMKASGIDGAKLSEVIDGDVSIRDCLDGVNLVDQQKISMFLRGWRPYAE